ncbi:glycosyltransferase family 4 protein [Sediminispirochaeta bajacaliforniensis]|uniref:glycosyltransferase family 4 protein n=1 Tax=Sediminispirochaeta bajacaliforniensis TaxID=148 RepID=UPI000376E50A|nr:glycosyltransferase family 4 protein [Sediminispirochaeta bajacaliforniensis]
MAKQVPDTFRVAIICGKLGDVDGVSLEVDKWIDVLLAQGHELYTFAGFYPKPLSSIPEERQFVVSDLRFGSEDQLEYENWFFPHLRSGPFRLSDDRKERLLEKLEDQGTRLANELFGMIQRYGIDVIIAQNTNAMPMALLAGMAVYKLSTERRVATIFHHHDFWWERSRFSHNHIEELLGMIMPPAEPGLEHVVLSSYAEHILRSFKRVHPRVIPNCEDFEHPPKRDDYNSRFRAELGFSDDDILIIQPTRIVRRKRIEDSVELVGRFLLRYPELASRVRFVISLYQGDEPDQDYIGQIRSMCKERKIDLRLISDRVTAQRGNDEKGRMMFTNRDVLVNADLVTYLPIWEGFGNALLEAVAAKVPIVTTTYLVYKTDIKIAGFDNIEIRDVYDEENRLIIPDSAVEEMHRLLQDGERRERMVEHNFEVGAREFGLATLRRLLRETFDDYGDEIRASRKRIEKSRREYPV